ncbi:MAG: hypothetical protein ACYSU7_02400 [Planctomycetota bacterium]|jgi:hypothetical protein
MSRSQPANTSAAVLWAAAFVVAALVIVQAGRLPGRSAYAETTANVNDFSLITARSGTGPDERPYELLFVIDSRAEALLVYELPNVQQGITLRDGGSLMNLFRTAGR